MSKTKGGCEISHCRGREDLAYLGKRICVDHWNELADDVGALRDALGLNAPKKAGDHGERK